MGTFSSLALIAASTGMSVARSIAAGNAQAQAANYQAAILRQQANTQRAFAAAEEQRQRRQQSQALSARSALFAARGIDPSAGSALLAQEQAAAAAEFDALLARAGALSRVTNLEASAQGADLSARNAWRSGLLNAGSNLLSGTERFETTRRRINGTSAGAIRDPAQS